MKTILILKECRSTGYLVDALADVWSRMGYRVITHSGSGNIPAAGIVFLHIDRTVVPPEYLECVKDYQIVINRQAVDISRNLYSTAVLQEGSAYDAPVIVKTILNYGGQPEFCSRDGGRCSASGLFAGISQRLRYKLLGYFMSGLLWEKRKSLDPLRYPLFETADEVPPGVWRNPNLIVEKFIPEREGDYYFIRYWTFFGDKGWSGRYGSRMPIVKYGRIATPDEPVPVPDELRAVRNSMGLDYGRIDFVIHEGVPCVLDVNKTLWGAEFSGAYKRHRELLAAGIAGYG